MQSRRAICVSADIGFRRAVEPALVAAGLAVEHRDRLAAASDAVLIVVDRAARLAAGAELRAIRTPVVVVGDSLDDELIAAMIEAPISHLIGDPHDDDLAITSEKLATGDVFGVEKYLARGTLVGERGVDNDIAKRHAIDALCAWAEAGGARRPIVHRLACVADELMMNALDAPGPEGRSARLRWGTDARTIAISVSDACGALRQRDVIDHVRRARSERGRPRPEGGAQRGAGIGLYLVLANVASLVVNVEAGRRTEVVCLFERATTEQPAARFVRSLHVFRAAAR